MDSNTTPLAGAQGDVGPLTGKVMCIVEREAWDALTARVKELEASLKETVHYVGESDTMFVELTAENRRLTALVDEAMAANLALGKYIADMQLAALESQPVASNAASAGVWMPIDHVGDGLDGVYADEIAITIGYEDTAMATFAWPEDGHSYRLCRLTASPQWEPVEYKHIFTPEARPLRPDYDRICEKWHYFNDEECDSDDYEYAICRAKKATDDNAQI